MTLILVRDPHTWTVIRSEAQESQPFAQVEANVSALMDTVKQQAAEIVRLKADIRRDPALATYVMVEERYLEAKRDIVRLQQHANQMSTDLVRLRRLVLEVASLGIVTDEDRVGPATPGHLWVEMPVALWDRVETEASRG